MRQCLLGTHVAEEGARALSAPSKGLREKEGRALLLATLRGPHATDEMMDLKALVKCKLKNLACKTLWLLLQLLLLLLMCQ